MKEILAKLPSNWNEILKATTRQQEMRPRVSRKGPRKSTGRDIGMREHLDHPGMLEMMLISQEVLPHVMRLILAWECPDKRPEETYKMYIEKRNGGPLSRGQWRRMGYWSNVLQRERNSENFDILVLYSLLSFLFAMNIAQEMEKKNLKTLLNTAKIFRNEVKHNAWAFMRCTYRDVILLVFDLLEEAALVYSLSSDQKLKTIENVKCQLNELDYVQFEQERDIKRHTIESLVEEGRKGTLQPSLIERRKPAFVFPQISPHKLLENDKKVVIVTGNAGSGKSTLLEIVKSQFLEPGASAVAPWKNLDIVVYCVCRNSASSFAEVIRQNFPSFCDKFGAETVERRLLKLRTLFLIDGYDEASSQFSVVLEELFYKVKCSESKMIVTTRPCASSSLRLYFNNEDISFQEFQLIPFFAYSIADQIEFPQKHEKSLSSGKSPGKGLENFSRLDKKVQELLKKPLFLVSFLHICESFPEGDRQCSTVFNFIDVCHSMYLKLILQETSNLQLEIPLKLLVEKSFAVMSDFALSLCAEKKLSFYYEEFMQLFVRHGPRNDRFRSLSSLPVGGETVVKSFFSNLTVMRNDCSAFRIRYSFRHSAFLHFYAARAVVTSLRKSPFPSLAEVLSTSKREEGDSLQGRLALHRRSKRGEGDSLQGRSALHRRSELGEGDSPHDWSALFGRSKRGEGDSLQGRSALHRRSKRGKGDSLQGRSALYCRFADVLPYVAFELSAPENAALLRARWPELKEALTAVGTTAEGWRELLDARPDNELLASEVASMSD